MNEWLKENWFKVALLVILINFIGGAFYWFEWRPSEIRRECKVKVLDAVRGSSSVPSSTQMETLLNFCLKGRGLEK